MDLHYQNLLVTTDLSDVSTTAFAHVNRLVKLIGEDRAKVTVLSVFEDVTAPGATPVPGQSIIEASGVMDRSFKESENDLDTLCKSHFPNLSVEKKSLRTGKAADQAIIDYAAENKIDLIIMSSSGRSHFGSLLLGSTAERVLRSAPCPVLLIPSTPNPTS